MTDEPALLNIRVYGNVFELVLNATTNADGTTTDTLIYKSYPGQRGRLG